MSDENDFRDNQETRAPRGRTCRCGHTRQHPFVVAEPHYSTFHFLVGIFMGVAAGDPKSIRFRCKDCGEVLEESRDPKVIAAHRSW